MNEAYGVMKKAHEAESLAREIEERGTDFQSPCDSNFEGKYCIGCKFFEECRSHDAEALFDQAWEGYKTAEGMIRRQVEETDSEESNALLAQLMMAIHIHPNSGLEQDTPALWESQYLWLKMYYRTRKESYMDMARMCEGFRNAYATLSDETDDEWKNEADDE